MAEEPYLRDPMFQAQNQILESAWNVWAITIAQIRARGRANIVRITLVSNVKPTPSVRLRMKLIQCVTVRGYARDAVVIMIVQLILTKKNAN